MKGGLRVWVLAWQVWPLIGGLHAKVEIANHTLHGGPSGSSLRLVVVSAGLPHPKYY
jgi:hypothetical protein